MFRANWIYAVLGVMGLAASQAAACGCGANCCAVAAPAPACCRPADAAPAPGCCRPAKANDKAAPAAMAMADKAEADKSEAEIKGNLAKLSPDDRKAAEAQKFCAVEDDHRLGEMGVPFKVTLKGQPVFLCCKGCVKEAEKEADKTLAKVKELKAKAGKDK